MKIIFMSGGAGNVFYQSNYMISKYGKNWAYSDLMYRPFLKKLLGHTQNTPPINSVFFRLGDLLGSVCFLILILDLAIFKLLQFTLLTHLDSTLYKAQPKLFCLIHYGYYQENFCTKKPYKFLPYTKVFECDPLMSRSLRAQVHETYVAIHVRGGDYIVASEDSSKRIATNMPLLDEAWYVRAVQASLVSVDCRNFFFVTDDVKSCNKIAAKVSESFANISVKVNSIGIWEDLSLLSQAEAIIIYNSTFAAMALSKSKDNILCITTPYMERKHIANIGAIKLKVFKI